MLPVTVTASTNSALSVIFPLAGEGVYRSSVLVSVRYLTPPSENDAFTSFPSGTVFALRVTSPSFIMEPLNVAALSS